VQGSGNGRTNEAGRALRNACQQSADEQSYKATKLENDAATILARPNHAAPAIEADPQASVFSQLTNIAADKAAALYAFWISLAFEFGAMLAMLIAYSNAVPAATQLPRTMVIAGVPLASSKNVVPMVPRQPKPAMIIGRHMLARARRKRHRAGNDLLRLLPLVRGAVDCSAEHRRVCRGDARAVQTPPHRDARYRSGECRLAEIQGEA
jgi:hypothetical protein